MLPYQQGLAWKMFGLTAVSPFCCSLHTMHAADNFGLCLLWGKPTGLFSSCCTCIFFDIWTMSMPNFIGLKQRSTALSQFPSPGVTNAVRHQMSESVLNHTLIVWISWPLDWILPQLVIGGWFYWQSATKKKHAKLTRQVKKKQNAHKSRLKTNSTKVLILWLSQYVLIDKDTQYMAHNTWHTIHELKLRTLTSPIVT